MPRSMTSLDREAGEPQALTRRGRIAEVGAGRRRGTTTATTR
jgi:hypothetical protein